MQVTNLRVSPIGGTDKRFRTQMNRDRHTTRNRHGDARRRYGHIPDTIDMPSRAGRVSDRSRPYVGERA